jgi:hypothetical protein
MKGDLMAWLKSGEHLPKFMRDFHDQKDLFKTIHTLYRENEDAEKKPNWVDGHIYVIDWFLWYMASRGYTLQKSRKQVDFKEHVVYNGKPFKEPNDE